MQVVSVVEEDKTSHVRNFINTHNSRKANDIHLYISFFINFYNSFL